MSQPISVQDKKYEVRKYETGVKGQESDIYKVPGDTCPHCFGDKNL